MNHQPDRLELLEREKYTRVWGSFPKYREVAPGASVAPYAWYHFGSPASGTLIDFGCGTGKAAEYFQRRGLDVTGVDIAANCLNPEVFSVPLVVACLWALPSTLKAKFGFCTDVLEHIPPERVDAVLAGIAASCQSQAYFQIATFEDRFGTVVGEPLHLTVRPPLWWYAQLGVHWPHVQAITLGGWSTFLCSKVIPDAATPPGPQPLSEAQA